MPRNALLLTGAGAAFICAVGVCAQPAPTPQERPSRVSPFDPRLMAPPAPRVIGPPQEDPPPTMAGFADATRMCMTVVSPQFEVQASLLPTAGWSWFQPRQVQIGAQTYEMVQYSKAGISLILLDGGPFVICRVVGEIEGAAQLNEVRATLMTTLGAVPVESVPRLAAYTDRIRQGAPQAVLANFMIAGDYTLELTLRERPRPATATAPAGTVRAVMIESVPLPPQFRSPAPAGAAH